MSDLFLRACRGESVERPPVWMMRQAGRYMAEYRALRAQHDFLSLCKSPDLAAEVTLQPVEALGVDAAILFADILLPLEAMGSELRFEKGEGPVFPDPVRKVEDLDKLVRPDVEDKLGYVYDALREIRKRLNARPEGPIPLIGFGGTPWTLAAYLVEGGVSKSFPHLLGWSWRDPKGLAVLLEMLADISADYLEGQIEAGAQAIQLFDTWGGLLDAVRWREIALPPVLRIVERLRDKKIDGKRVPLTFYIRGARHLLEELKDLPFDVLSLDWCTPLNEVREIVESGGKDWVLQGNLDPTVLLGSPESIVRETHKLLAAGARKAAGAGKRNGGGHIANLGHGILPPTPVAHARTFIETVQAWRGEGSS